MATAESALRFTLFAKDQTGPGIKSAESGFSKFGKGLVSKVAAAGAAIGAVSLFGSFISEARESEKVSRLTAAAIKSTGGAAKVTAAQVGALSTALSNKSGVDDEVIQSGQNLLLTFTNIRNGVGKSNKIFDQASAAALDMTAAMNHGDVSADGLKSSSIQLGKALNDPIKGITALTRVGVTFTDAQKNQIKAMVASGDTMGAQKVILAELNKEFGGAAAAAADPAQKASVAWGNLKEQIGMKFLPVLNKVMGFLSSKAIPAISKLITNVASGGGAFAKFRAGLAAVGAFISNTVVPLLKRFGDWFVTVGWPAIQKFASAFWKDLQPALRQIAASFNNDLKPALENAIAKFKEAWPTIQRVLNILGQVAGFILTKVVPVIVQLYAKHLAAVIRVFGELFSVVWRFVGVLIDAGKKIWDFGVAVKNVFVTMKNGAVSAIVLMSDVFLGFVGGVLRGFQLILEGLGHVPKWLGGGKFDDAAGAIGKIIDGVEALKRSIDGLKDKTIHLTVQQRIEQTKAMGGYTLPSGNLKAPSGTQLRAKGGPVSARSPYIVGEHGPELFVPGKGGKIIPNGAGAMSGYPGNPAMAGVGGRSAPVMVTFDLAGGAGDKFIQAIREAIRVKGGNVQLVLGKN